MPRFVILTHNYPFPHWDLMLQWGPALRSWRLMKSPDAPGAIAAQAIGDHRLEYLDYEGRVSRGRGEVRQWDRGQFEIAGGTVDRLEIVFSGLVLDGSATLTRAGNDQWAFRFSPAHRDLKAP